MKPPLWTRLAPNRREALALGAAALALDPFAIAQAQRLAQSVALARAEIDRFTGGAEALRGKVALDLPAVAENGASVPVSIAVESPMSAGDFVERVLLVTTANPYARALSVSFTPACGRAEVTTRIRLAATQEVFAVAKMSGGTFYFDSKTVAVTVGGCGG